MPLETAGEKVLRERKKIALVSPASGAVHNSRASPCFNIYCSVLICRPQVKKKLTRAPEKTHNLESTRRGHRPPRARVAESRQPRSF